MNDKQCDAIDVLKSIDQLRRDLSGYHGQLKAHNDLQRHCDRQREQLAALGAAHKPIKDERDSYKRQAERLAAENAKLREFAHDMWNDMNVCYTQHESPDSSDMAFYRDSMRELGIEVTDE